MVALLGGVMLIEADRPSPWPAFALNCAALWSFFMLPMTVTALTVLTAQLEHGPKFWNHLLALPVARWRLYAAKAAVVMLLVGATALAAAARPRRRPGRGGAGARRPAHRRLDWGASARDAGRIRGSAADRHPALGPRFASGASCRRSSRIGGTFAAVVATGASSAPISVDIPTNALSSDPDRAALPRTDLGGLRCWR